MAETSPAMTLTGGVMGLDPDAARVLAAGREAGLPAFETLSAEAARAQYSAGRAALLPVPMDVAEVRDLRADGRIPVRLYRPEGAGVLPVLVFFHGGGWVLGDLRSHDGLCRHLAARSGCAVMAVDYRLAPEHRFPAAFEDAVAATGWVQAHAGELGLDPGRMAVGGDSAGGTLAATVCLQARESGGPMPRWQLLIYPATDLAMDTDSYRAFAEGYGLTRANMAWFAGHYLGGADRGDWRVSPSRAAGVAGLPAAFVVTAEFDPLRDEGEAYLARLVAAGVRATGWRIAGQIHGFLPSGKVMSCAGPILDLLARQMALELMPG